MNAPMKRRDALKFAAAGAAAGMAGAVAGCATGTTPGAPVGAREPMRWNDPIWNREASARLEGDTAPGRFVHGSAQGVVCAVQPGRKVQPILGFDVFSSIRVVKQPDGSYQRLCRELVFYRDPATRKLIDTYDNPLTGEKVRVVEVHNDPFNWKISEWYPEPPSYGGLNAADRPPRKPFLLDWRMEDDETVGLTSDIHLHYPSALRPEKWPRESPGAFTQASEFFRYFIRKDDLENAAMTHVPHHGVWNRVTPWLPWLLMDQAPGHCFYAGTFGSKQRLDQYPPDVLARAQERYPLYLTAPTEWVDPSLSSLEHYAREQQPAPPKAPKS